MKLFHVSDLHVSRSPEKNQILQTKLERVRSEMTSGDWLLVSGDLVDDGLGDQYDEARRLLAAFKGRVALVPGNHDYGLVGIGYSSVSERSFWNMAREFGSADPNPDTRTYHFGDVRLFVLDSCLKTGSPFDFSRGEIGAQQLAWMDQRMRDAHDEGKRVIITLHHHPHESWALALEDVRELLRHTWGIAEYVLFGHKHEEAMWKAERVPTETVFHAAGTFRDPAVQPFVIDLGN